MLEQREVKRVRQACQNCRRKKSKCDGQKPACSFCHRLKQPCNYDDGPSRNNAINSSNSDQDINLAARVALLEAKLSFLNGNANQAVFGTAPTNYLAPAKRKTSSGETTSSTDKAGDSPDSTTIISESTRKFTHLPPDSALRSILNTYFEHCQNQPYVYFRQARFYRKLDNGELPEYLLMAMIAIAARFSNDAFFESRQLEAIETYAGVAWNALFNRAFADDYDLLEIQAVQAINILAVVNFTAGLHQLGWVKIGLAVRLAQSLQLNSELRASSSPEEQDERRLTFWSVYLLDRLSSCGAHRPPTIADGDCSVLLPSDDPETTMPDLRALSNIISVHEKTENLGSFAHTILMASALGRIERLMLQHQSYNDQYPPWDSRSDFTAIYCMLLSFEGYSHIMDSLLSETISRYATHGDHMDNQGAGHLIFSTILYHMNQCLLHHPFLLRKRLETWKARVPLSFLRESLRRCLEHAYQLTITLRTVQKSGLTPSSFYAYAVMVAGSIYKLFVYHDDEGTRETTKQLLEHSVDFLEKMQGFWGHYPKIAMALKNFTPDPVSARALVTANHSAVHHHPDSSLDIVENLLDYGWLSDPARSSLPPSPATNLDTSGGSADVAKQNAPTTATPPPPINVTLARQKSQDQSSPHDATTVAATTILNRPTTSHNESYSLVDRYNFDLDNAAQLQDEDLGMDFITHADVASAAADGPTWNSFVNSGNDTLDFPTALSSALPWGTTTSF